MYQIRDTILNYAYARDDGSIRLISCIDKKYAEIVVQNGNIVNAYAGMSHTYYKVCTETPNEAIDYMSYCPECLAELLVVLSKSSICYKYARDLLIQKANEMQKKLDKINKILSE